MKTIKVNISIQNDFLESRNITIEDVENHVRFLLKTFNEKYLVLFPTEVSGNDIDKIINTSNCLHKIAGFDGFDGFDGFERHIKLYNKREFNSHIYCAEVAGFLGDNGFKVIMEPIMDSHTGPHPDLQLEKNGNVTYVECKTAEISNLYKPEVKIKIANLILEKIDTPFEIELTFNKSIDFDAFKEMLDDSFINEILSVDKNLNEEFVEWEIRKGINIKLTFQSSSISTNTNSGLVVYFDLYVINDATDIGNKSIGIKRIIGKRSIGIYEMVNYKKKLKSKRRASSNQMVAGYPNLVFIKGINVVGDEVENKTYIRKTWLTKQNEWCSGIVFFDVHRFSYWEEIKTVIDYLANPHAKAPIRLK